MHYQVIKVLEVIKNHQSVSYSELQMTKNEFGDVVSLIKTKKYASNIYVRKMDEVYTMIDISEGDLTSKGYAVLADALNYNITEEI